MRNHFRIRRDKLGKKAQLKKVIVKHNPQDYKEKSKNHFDEISSDYSNALGKYTEPMHHALKTKLNGINFKTLLDVALAVQLPENLRFSVIPKRNLGGLNCSQWMNLLHI